jgi:hypothetical protein
MMLRSGLVVAAVLGLNAPALAHPGAAPWEADGRPGRDSCTTCHFEAEPVRHSDKLQLLGLPAKVEPGRTYSLTVELKHLGMKVAGFLLALDPSAGAFDSGPTTEAKGAAIRSTLAAAKQGEEARWTLIWRAPERMPPEVAFHLSANAGNDDQSPFGDIIYLDVVKAAK